MGIRSALWASSFVLVLAACGDDDGDDDEDGGGDACMGTGCVDGDTPDGDIEDGDMPDRPDRPDAPPVECTVGSPCDTRGCRMNADHECTRERALTIGGVDDPITDHEGAIDAIYFRGGYCSPKGLRQYGVDSLACNPDSDNSCADDGCSSCIVLTADNGTMCLRNCEPSQTESTCPGDGQNCDVVSHVCQPFGCSNDDECRTNRRDTNGNGEIDPYNETTNPTGDNLVYDLESEAVCNLTTWRCDNPGAEGAFAGKLCEQDSECEENGDCLGEVTSGWPGGYCTKFGCDIAGRDCATPDDGSDVVCQVRGVGAPVCLIACTVGAEDDTEEMDELGETGHGVGCREGYTCVWNGMGGRGEENNGACQRGEYNAVTEANIGAPCEAASDCYSPYGAARCIINDAFGRQGYCSVFDCAAPGIPSDICGEDAQCIPFSGSGTTLCLSNCDSPSDCAAEGEDPNSIGCIEFDGDETSSRICFPACAMDEDCQEGFECQVPSGSTTGECVES